MDEMRVNCIMEVLNIKRLKQGRSNFAPSVSSVGLLIYDTSPQAQINKLYVNIYPQIIRPVLTVELGAVKPR